MTDRYPFGLYPFLSKIRNDSISQEILPNSLKMADIAPGHKKFDKSNKDNYRPVSILPTISKVFERNMFEQIDTYMSDYLSNTYVGLEKVIIPRAA